MTGTATSGTRWNIKRTVDNPRRPQHTQWAAALWKQLCVLLGCRNDLGPCQDIKTAAEVFTGKVRWFSQVHLFFRAFSAFFFQSVTILQYVFQRNGVPKAAPGDPLYLCTLFARSCSGGSRYIRHLYPADTQRSSLARRIEYKSGKEKKEEVEYNVLVSKGAFSSSWAVSLIRFSGLMYICASLLIPTPRECEHVMRGFHTERK